MIDQWMGQRRKLADIGQQCRHYIESYWTIEQVIERWLRVLFNGRGSREGGSLC